MGFTSSNDRGFINVLKNLGFLSSDSVPTSYYAELRDGNSKKIIAMQIREYYKDLFIINTNMNEANDTEIRGAISRVTGKEEKDVKRMAATFKALCNYADFTTIESKTSTPNAEIAEEHTQSNNGASDINNKLPEFHYNIQIHLPATTDISVYNAIFKSIKENLFK